MPYIFKAERKRYDKQIKKLVELLVDKFPGENGRDYSEGDLNYIISSIVWKLFAKAPSYRQANKLVGVLECAKLEFYRRKVAIHEDHKIACPANGDL